MVRRLAIRQGCHVVVTAGELGLWWSDGQAVRRVPAVPVQARDVCGAGDTVLVARVRLTPRWLRVVLPNDTTKETKTPRDLRLWSNAKFVGDRLDRVLTAYGKPPTYHGDSNGNFIRTPGNHT